MSNPKRPPQPNQGPAPEVAVRIDLDSLDSRIAELQALIAGLQKEINALKGKYANSDPKLEKSLRLENDALQARFHRLEKAFLALLREETSPRGISDEKLDYEILNQAAVEYFKLNNIDPKLWKNLVS